MQQPSNLEDNANNDDGIKASGQGEGGRSSSPGLGNHQLPNGLSKGLLGLPMSSPRSLASALASPRLGDYLMSPRYFGPPCEAGGESLDITAPASCAGLSSLFDLTPQHSSRAGEASKAGPYAPRSAQGSGASSDAQLHSMLLMPTPPHNMQGPIAAREGSQYGDRTIEQVIAGAVNGSEVDINLLHGFLQSPRQVAL
ncbi:hypothetical protein DUNSADRAFT_15983 [Dunaliella salina]|uniref:Encoded protein n=1 Tax=Dunaliella salina TaxID=3046 RepID=A0ABQ7G4F9_DUNSA|nr:hypothetical protein DUNSADRAFT_15983 [Dunaliella salina]|eukprot:KAF5829499.1 hypothetical protein DUNSADRAFT_15983 [Dunaliella salina]